MKELILEELNQNIQDYDYKISRLKRENEQLSLSVRQCISRLNDLEKKNINLTKTVYLLTLKIQKKEKEHNKRPKPSCLLEAKITEYFERIDGKPRVIKYSDLLKNIYGKSTNRAKSSYDVEKLETIMGKLGYKKERRNFGYAWFLKEKAEKEELLACDTQEEVDEFIREIEGKN